MGCSGAEEAKRSTFQITLSFCCLSHASENQSHRWSFQLLSFSWRLDAVTQTLPLTNWHSRECGGGGLWTQKENTPSFSGKMNHGDERDSFVKSAALFGVSQRSDWFIWQEVTALHFHVPANFKGDFVSVLLLPFWFQVLAWEGTRCGNEKHWRGRKRGQRRDWGQRGAETLGTGRGEKKKQMENVKQISSPLISSPATHYATKRCASQGHELNREPTTSEKSSLPALSPAS